MARQRINAGRKRVGEPASRPSATVGTITEVPGSGRVSRAALSGVTRSRQRLAGRSSQHGHQHDSTGASTWLQLPPHVGRGAEPAPRRTAPSSTTSASSPALGSSRPRAAQARSPSPTTSADQQPSQSPSTIRARPVRRSPRTTLTGKRISGYTQHIQAMMPFRGSPGLR